MISEMASYETVLLLYWMSPGNPVWDSNNKLSTSLSVPRFGGEIGGEGEGEGGGESLGFWTGAVFKGLCSAAAGVGGGWEGVWTSDPSLFKGGWKTKEDNMSVHCDAEMLNRDHTIHITALC